MIVFHHVKSLRAGLACHRNAGKQIGAVLTMGALHEGHLALFARARAQCNIVVGTIFVNPAQFEKKSDLKAYPINIQGDIDALRAAKVDFLFIPAYDEIYPLNDETIVETQRSANILHGKTRKGHFRGVTTVVARFFNIIQPDIAFFGEKDYQQLQLIKRMVKDLHFPISICGHETVRAPDGLALSSRNQRLNKIERTSATVLYRALEAARLSVRPINVLTIKELIREIVAKEHCAQNLSIDIVDPENLTPLEGDLRQKAMIMISAEFGEVLLLDQMLISPDVQTK